jgi:hypothetical protein
MRRPGTYRQCYTCMLLAVLGKPSEAGMQGKN